MSYQYLPAPYEFILLALASYRLWRLLAEDDILDTPRGWLLGLPRGWSEGDPIPFGYRYKLADFITCPWCFGFWISIAVYLSWAWEPDWAIYASVVLAISAITGAINHYLSLD